MKDLTDADFNAWPNFSRPEFACKCGCGQCCMDPRFMDIVQAIRHEYGKAMAISSGYRCPKRNMEVAHSGDSGPHTTGRALDVLVSGADAIQLLGIALRHGIHGVGVAQKGASRYLHLDQSDPALYPRPGIWSY